MNAPLRTKPTLEGIARATAAEFDISLKDLLSHTRLRHIARPRQHAMALAYELTSKSYPQVGEFFNRDHTTVMHAHSQANLRLLDNPELADRIDRIITAATPAVFQVDWVRTVPFKHKGDWHGR